MFSYQKNKTKQNRLYGICFVQSRTEIYLRSSLIKKEKETGLHQRLVQESA